MLGAALDPVKLPKILSARKLSSVNESAGVVVGFATLVVNNGDKLPAENDVTVPAPPAPIGPIPVTYNTGGV